jgi:hypothetical protein
MEFGDEAREKIEPAASQPSVAVTVKSSFLEGEIPFRS